MSQIYKGVRTEELFVVNCKTAIRVVRGMDCVGRSGCSLVACACNADDVRFVKATPAEAEGFFRAVSVMGEEMAVS